MSFVPAAPEGVGQIVADLAGRVLVVILFAVLLRIEMRARDEAAAQRRRRP